MASSTSKSTGLPGLHVPLDHFDFDILNRELFPSALDPPDGTCVLSITTLREFAMLQLMNYLTDKTSWETKIFDETIAAKWKSEALAMENHDISPEMLDWIIEELKWKAEIFHKTGAVSIYNGDVVKSDSTIPPSLKEALRVASKSLEDIPEAQVDYHPGSNGRVIDLVHPSLFPLVYGRSHVLNDTVVDLDDCFHKTGLARCIPVPEVAKKEDESWERQRSSETPLYSTTFQWLPCDVKFKDGDEGVKIVSYINNLHPRKHKNLYSVIEQIISKVVPLWNMTLTPCINPEEFKVSRIPYSGPVYDPDPECVPEDQCPQQDEGEDEDEFYEREAEWTENFRAEHLMKPNPGEFKRPQEDILKVIFPNDDEYDKGVNLRRQFGEQGLQVIVKLATIRLIPEKPSYEGGTWHVEGQLNEHVCATALYYYDNNNITESRLAFRQQGDDDMGHMDYHQNDHGWVGPIFGLETDTTTVQDVGDVVCKEDRVLTFPNILQHCVKPFKLEDPRKPGHRKILALFLVDPHIRIISTANVPPQQRDWWSEEVLSTNAFDRLPKELQNLVFEDVEFPIGLKEAKELRVQLMEERKKFVTKQNELFEDVAFSLCEH